MVFIVRKSLLTVANPILQLKRYRGKINIQKPRPPHFERAKYLALTKPFFPKQKEDICDKYVDIWKKSHVENPYERFLAKELLELLQTSQLVAFYHRNSMSGEEIFKARVLFHRINMKCNIYGRKTLAMAITDTPYEVLMKLYVSHNMMVFSPELNIKELLKVSKKLPAIVLLAGIMEGKFVSVDELQQYSLIPNIQAAQAQLVQTLNNVGGQVVSQLTTHQNILVSQLNERVKQLEEQNKSV